MAPRKGRPDHAHLINHHAVKQAQKQSQRDGDGDEDNNVNYDGLRQPPIITTAPNPTPVPIGHSPTAILPLLASSLPVNNPISTPTFPIVSTFITSQPASTFSTGTAFTPVTRLTSTTLDSQQASTSSTEAYTSSNTQPTITTTASLRSLTTSASSMPGTTASEVSTRVASVLSASSMSLPSANATPFGESMTGKAANAPAVIAGSICGVLAIVLLILFAVYRKRTCWSCFDRRGIMSGRPPTNPDPEITMTYSTTPFDANSPGPLQRNPPNVADFFSFNVPRALPRTRQRPETPENLSTVMEETASQHSRSPCNSPASFPTPLVAQAAHMSPAATTNADDIPLLSSHTSPFIIPKPESAQRDSRHSLTTRFGRCKGPAARKSIHRDRESTESVESAPRFRTVESWVDSQAKRLNLPPVHQDSRPSERISSAPSETQRSFTNPPMPPPKARRIPTIPKPGGRTALGHEHQKEMSASTAAIFRQHPGEEVKLEA